MTASERLPAVSGGEVVRALERAGISVVRIAGSPHRLVHRDAPGRAVTVPVHGTRTLRKGTPRAILRQAELDVETFRAPI